MIPQNHMKLGGGGVCSRMCWNRSFQFNSRCWRNSFIKRSNIDSKIFRYLMGYNEKSIIVIFFSKHCLKRYFCYNRKTMNFKAMFGKATKKNPRVKKKLPVARVWHRIGPGFSLLKQKGWPDIRSSSSGNGLHCQVPELLFHLVIHEGFQQNVLARAQMVISLVTLECRWMCVKFIKLC